MSAPSELDGNKVVDIDLGSNEFKQNARDILAQWAKRPPFYVLSSGPAQVICGRYADVHEIFSDTERFSSELPKGHGFEQFDKFMGVQFITQMDGERHARIRRLLMPAFSARSLSRLETRIVKSSMACSTRSRPAAMNSTACRIMERSWWSARC